MLLTEITHFAVFLIGIVIMIAGVAVIMQSTNAAPYIMFTGGGIATLAMISQAVKYLRTGEM